MMFDQHVPDSLLHSHALVLPGEIQDVTEPDLALATNQPLGQLPVMSEVEGELSQDPQLALDEDPAGRGCQAGGTVPGLQGGRGRAQGLPPQVEHLLVEAETDERPQLDIHLDPRLVSVECEEKMMIL